METATKPNVYELLEKVDAMAPIIRKHAIQAEKEKRLSPIVLNAMRDAGFFRMFRPESRGGMEFDPVSQYRVAEAIARIDSAAAWNLQVCSASETFGGWFDDETTEAVFGNPETIVAGSFNPPRKAVVVEGGYRITGQTPFNSNCHGATWFAGLADVYDGEVLRTDDAGIPVTVMTMFPASDAQIIETWNTMGMCGTGSHDVAINDLFVPESYAPPFMPLENPHPAYDWPCARMATWITCGCHAAVSLGIAQAAIDDLIELGLKVPAYTERSLRDRNVIQLRLAQADAKLKAARALFHATFNDAWNMVQRDSQLDLHQKSKCQSAATHLSTTAAEVVDLIHSCVGATGIRDENRFQKHFRDIHVITQHAFVSESRMEAVGQIMFGLEPDWPFFNF